MSGFGRRGASAITLKGVAQRALGVAAVGGTAAGAATVIGNAAEKHAAEVGQYQLQTAEQQRLAAQQAQQLAEAGGKILDMEGEGALAYFESSRRTPGQVDRDRLPLYQHDRQASKRHTRIMREALDHMLAQAPEGAHWAAITIHPARVEG